MLRARNVPTAIHAAAEIRQAVLSRTAVREQISLNGSFLSFLIPEAAILHHPETAEKIILLLPATIPDQSAEAARTALQVLQIPLIRWEAAGATAFLPTEAEAARTALQVLQILLIR